MLVMDLDDLRRLVGILEERSEVIIPQDVFWVIEKLQDTDSEEAEFFKTLLSVDREVAINL